VNYLLDTNILSELRKSETRRNPGLVRWISDVQSEQLYLSVLVVGEIRKGIEQVRGPDPKQALALETWLGKVESFYAERILPITIAVAERWGRAQAIHNFSVIDGLLAATADEHGLQFVSRNIQDLELWPSVHPFLNPFSE